MSRKWTFTAVSLALSVLLMVLLLGRLEPGSLGRALRGIYGPALLAYLAFMLLGAAVRALRYKWFLKPAEIGWGPILLVTFIRNSLVDLLPARLGSLSFIYVMNKRLGYTFEMVSSAFILAFVFDFLTLSPFLVAAVFAVGFGITSLSGTPLVVLAAAFFLIVFLVLRKIEPVLALAGRAFGWAVRRLKLGDKPWTKLAQEKIRSTQETLSWIRRRNIYWQTFFLSLALRLLKYISLYFLLYALLRGGGFGLETANFWITVLGLTGAELTSALPVKGLAGFGTWESAWALTLRLMGFDAQTAILSGIGVHLLTNLVEYSLGIGSLLILIIPYLKERKHNKERSS